MKDLSDRLDAYENYDADEMDWVQGAFKANSCKNPKEVWEQYPELQTSTKNLI